jgi:hypothetical protein
MLEPHSTYFTRKNSKLIFSLDVGVFESLTNGNVCLTILNEARA